MSSIKHYIANSTQELSKFDDLISASLRSVIPLAEKELCASQIDIIFVSAANSVIPEYGIGGYSPGPNHIYVSFDPRSDKITQQHLSETLLHEIHHCMRWREPGYGNTLGKTIITEGLACLYEEQYSKHVPIYARAALKDCQILEAKKAMDNKDYNHAMWFFGTDKIDRWFGYSYGYKLCKDYSIKAGKNASELINVDAKKILEP